jgi:hypothetical protein
MKISLALGRREPLSRQTAWGCLTSNLALPGAGSLAAGRRSGYAQGALAVGGTVLTTVFGLRFMAWVVANWSRVYGEQADASTLVEMWAVVKWALLGIGIFGMGWLWALATGLEIVRSARDKLPANIPPRLG